MTRPSRVSSPITVQLSKCFFELSSHVVQIQDEIAPPRKAPIAKVETSSPLVYIVTEALSCKDLKEAGLPRPVRELLELIVLILGNRVAQIDQELCEASLSGCIVSEDCRESRVSERFRQTLTESLSCSVVVAEPRWGSE